MKRFDVISLLMIEAGLVMFLVGALSDSSLLGQLSAAAGSSDPTSRDLRWLGVLTMVISVIVNFLEPRVPLEDLASPATFDGPVATQVNVCAALLIGCFFLPWAQVMGLSASGFELMKLGSIAVFSALIPVTALLILVNNLMGFYNRILITVVGTLPFLALAIGLAKTEGQGFRVLSFGAYFVLIVAAAMILLANNVVRRVSSRLEQQRV